MLAMKTLIPAVALTLATAAAAAPCEAPEHRQFDFWLGQWEVRTPDGTPVGRNRIERRHGGCVLHEAYVTDRGYAGESVNVWDASRRVWHQTWVDNQGTLLLLDGGLRGTSMVMEGKTRDTAGTVTRHRITWTPNADGSVRQHWESTDATGKWTTAFDGRYTH